MLVSSQIRAVNDVLTGVLGSKSYSKWLMLKIKLLLDEAYHLLVSDDKRNSQIPVMV